MGLWCLRLLRTPVSDGLSSLKVRPEEVPAAEALRRNLAVLESENLSRPDNNKLADSFENALSGLFDSWTRIEGLRGRLRAAQGRTYTGVRAFAEIIDKCILMERELSLSEISDSCTEYLKQGWDAEAACRLFWRTYPCFAEARKALKTKNNAPAVRSRQEISGLDLSELFTPDEFSGDSLDKAVSAFSVSGFVPVKAILPLLTHDGWFLKGDRTLYMQVTTRCAPDSNRCVQYTLSHEFGRPDVMLCPYHMQTDTHHMEPWLDAGQRLTGKRVLSFQLPIAKAGELLEMPNLNGFSISGWKDGPDTFNKAFYIPNGFGLSLRSLVTSPNAEVASILSSAGQSANGSREELANRLVSVIEEEYENQADSLSDLFRRYRTLMLTERSGAGDTRPGWLLSVPTRIPDLRQAVLYMYVFLHLRGNTVVDPDQTETGVSVHQLAERISQAVAAKSEDPVPALNRCVWCDTAQKGREQ